MIQLQLNIETFCIFCICFWNRNHSNHIAALATSLGIVIHARPPERKDLRMVKPQSNSSVDRQPHKIFRAKGKEKTIKNQKSGGEF